MSLGPTEVFLQRVLAWPTSGTPTDYYDVHWFFPNARGTNGKILAGRACKSPSEMLTQIGYRSNRADTLDIYFGLATQAKATEKIGASGHKYLAAQRSKDDAVHIRCLVIDIDVKKDAYPSYQAAVTALVKFLADSGMPQPTYIVETGSGGVHVYWCIHEILNSA